MDKLKKLIRYDKKIMTFLNIIAIIGIITGSIFVVILNKSDKSLVMTSIKDVFNNLQTNNVNYLLTLKNTLFANSLFAFIIWIIGISVIGVIITILIIFYKSFTLGFTIASIIYTYSIKGTVLALLYIFPHLLINVLLFLYLGSYSIKLSIILIKSIFRKENLNFKEFLNSYLKVLGISLLFIIISGFYETFIAPYILSNYLHLLVE